MESLGQQSLHGVDFQPIFEKVDDAKQLQTSIKSGATQSIDHAIRTLQSDKKLISANSEFKPLVKIIDKEIKNLQSLKKTIGKAKLETGDQALKLSEKVQVQIQNAAKNTNDKKVVEDSGLKVLEQMARRFDSVVTEAGQKLNEVVEHEFDNIPTQQLTFKEKIDKILKQILNLVVRDPAHTELSQVEKRANSLEKLCKQKEAAIDADLRKGMPIEEANRKAVGKVNEEMTDFKSFLKGSYAGLHAKYSQQRATAHLDLQNTKYEARELGKLATIIQRNVSTLFEMDGKSTSEQDKALTKLINVTSKHLTEIKKIIAKLPEEIEEDLEAGYSAEEKENLQYQRGQLTKLAKLLESQEKVLKILENSLKDASPDSRANSIERHLNNVMSMSKQIEQARIELIGDATKRLKDADTALKALEDCCRDEWPGLEEPNLRNNKSVDTYVKETKSRIDKGMAFFFNQRA